MVGRGLKKIEVPVWRIYAASGQLKTVVEEVYFTYIILLLRNKRLKFVKFDISKTRHGIEFLFDRNVKIVKGPNHADLQGHANY